MYKVFFKYPKIIPEIFNNFLQILYNIFIK